MTQLTASQVEVLTLLVDEPRQTATTTQTHRGLVNGSTARFLVRFGLAAYQSGGAVRTVYVTDKGRAALAAYRRTK